MIPWSGITHLPVVPTSLRTFILFIIRSPFTFVFVNLECSLQMISYMFVICSNYWCPFGNFDHLSDESMADSRNR